MRAYSILSLVVLHPSIRTATARSYIRVSFWAKVKVRFPVRGIVRARVRVRVVVRVRFQPLVAGLRPSVSHLYPLIYVNVGALGAATGSVEEATW